MFFLKKSVSNFAVVVGTRPNFVKAAAFFRRAHGHPRFKFTGVHTGQHFDDQMSGVFFNELQLPIPEINLNIGGELSSEKIGLMFDTIKAVFKQQKFSGAVVFGDVNSTLAAALAASKYHVPLIHIEAGLRSHDRRMPEEINRVIVDHLSRLLFASELSAVENLRREGAKEKKIHLVGNIMIESMQLYKDQISRSTILERLSLKEKSFILATIHRQENTDSPMQLKKVLLILDQLAQRRKVIFPLHPGTRRKIAVYDLNPLLARIDVIEPLGYFDFTRLLSSSMGVVTDSGGIQEETSYLGVACATLRDNTERPITLELGSNCLCPVDSVRVEDVFKHLSRNDFVSHNIPLWDSLVTQRIFSVLEQTF